MKKIITFEGGYKIKPRRTECASTLLARMYKGVNNFGTTMVMEIYDEETFYRLRQVWDKSEPDFEHDSSESVERNPMQSATTGSIGDIR